MGGRVGVGARVGCLENARDGIDEFVLPIWCGVYIQIVKHNRSPVAVHRSSYRVTVIVNMGKRFS